MTSNEPAKAPRHKFRVYDQFERIALVCVMIMIAAATAFTIVVTAIKLASDMLLGDSFLDRAALQDNFGLILIVLILLEFNHSVFVALTERSGAIQARILVRIAILVVARKLMLMDFAATEVRMLLGFGGLLLALGGLYWLILDGDRRQPSGSSELPAAHP